MCEGPWGCLDTYSCGFGPGLVVVIRFLCEFECMSVVCSTTWVDVVGVLCVVCDGGAGCTSGLLCICIMVSLSAVLDVHSD
jgi:hypothetical protein